MLMLLGFVLQFRAADAHDDGHDARCCFRDCWQVWQLMLMVPDAHDARGCFRDCWEVWQLMPMMLGVVLEIAGKCSS